MRRSKVSEIRPEPGSNMRCKRTRPSILRWTFRLQSLSFPKSETHCRYVYVAILTSWCSVRSKKGIHLVIDAGHLAIESNLVEKSQVQEIYSKRNQQYTDEDYKRLENLMYDRYSLKLHAAQFVIGNDLDLCMTALTSETERGCHLLERTSIAFSIQNSILPSALQLARLRVSGNLPELKVNLSNVKYKALMRLIDIAIPKLGEPEPQPKRIPKRPELQGLPLSSNVFAQSRHEYTVDEEGSEDGDDGDEFHDATEDAPVVSIGPILRGLLFLSVYCSDWI